MRASPQFSGQRHSTCPSAPVRQPSIAFIARRWCAFKRLPYADMSCIRPASNNAAKRSLGAVSMTSPRSLLQECRTQLRDQIINQHPAICATFVGHVDIARCGLRAAVAEQFLHAAQVQSHLNEVRGVGMAQAEDRDLLVYFAIRNHAGESLLGAAAIHHAGSAGTIPRKQQLGVPMLAPIAPQTRQGQRRQHYKTIFVALAITNMNLPSACVDIINAQVQCLGKAQPQAVGCLPHIC